MSNKTYKLKQEPFLIINSISLSHTHIYNILDQYIRFSSFLSTFYMDVMFHNNVLHIYSMFDAP